MIRSMYLVMAFVNHFSSKKGESKRKNLPAMKQKSQKYERLACKYSIL